MDLQLFILLPICLAVSFLCSGMEAGLFTLGRWRIVQQMRAGHARAARLYRYLQAPENFLWTVLVGNTVAVFGAMWIVAIALLDAVDHSSLLFWLCFFAAAFLFYMLCDLLPKTLFRKFPNRLCTIVSSPFRLLHITLTPLVAIVEALAQLLLRWTGGKTFKGQAFSTRNELRLLMEDPTAETLTNEERTMVHRVFELNNLTVRQLTIPFARSPIIPANELLRDAFERFRQLPQNLLPVAHEKPGHRRIAGFVDLKRLIFNQSIDPGDPVRKHIRQPLYLDEDLRLHEALRRLQRTGHRTAVVLARDQKEIGLITLEEILKFIFGEVRL